MSDYLKLTFEVPHQSLTPARAREAVQTLLGDDASIAMIRDAILLTSELVSNALVHAPGACVLEARFERDRSWLRVDVADSSARPPHPQEEPTVARAGGHGLRLVDEVAHRWGWSPRSFGKVVWFEILGAASSHA